MIRTRCIESWDILFVDIWCFEQAFQKDMIGVILWKHDASHKLLRKLDLTVWWTSDALSQAYKKDRFGNLVHIGRFVETSEKYVLVA